VTRRRSLVARLIAAGALWAVVLLVAGAIGLTAFFRASVYRDLDDGLSAVLDALVAYSETDETGDLSVSRRFADPRYEQVFAGRYWQIASPGESGLQPEARSRSLWDMYLDLPAETVQAALAAPGQHQLAQVEGPSEQPLRVLAEAVSLPDRDEPLIFIAAADRTAADRAIRNFSIAAAWTLASFAAALILALIIQVRVGLAPLFRMQESVARIREGEQDRLEEDYPKEIASLAEELNSLIAHNQDVVERARTHVGNLAHALKTPVAVLLNESRASDSVDSRIVLRQSEVMSRQVDHHLRRARAAARGRAAGAAPVADVIKDLARTIGRIHAAKGLDISVAVDPSLRFRGERQDLEEMAGNLIENAAKWAESRLRVSASVDGAQLHLAVEDDGPGLPPERREEAISRGGRLDETAPGTGLGLAIVNDLARAYAGSLELGESEMGGLTARLALPRAGSVKA